MILYTPGLDERIGAVGPPYRSRGEARVGAILDQYGIPFYHERPTLVHDRGRHRIWHPDFTLPTYDWLIVEYAGMPDVPDYMQGIRHKKESYSRNEIPAAFIYPWDLAGRDSSEAVMRKMDEAYRGQRR